MLTHTIGSLCALLLIIIGEFKALGTSCGCDNEALCHPIPLKPGGFGFFGFTTDQSPATYTKFDWTKLSTLIVIGITPQLPSLVCYAKARKVRVTLLTDISVADLLSPNKTNAYIENAVAKVKNNNLDGLNMDFESSIATNGSAYNALTSAMTKLRAALLKANSSYSLSMDYVYCAQCSRGRTYDFRKLKDVIDYFILMEYDMQGASAAGYERVKGTNYCTILSNSPFPVIYKYTENFLSLGVPPSKLVLAFPWYGYLDRCDSFDYATQTCYANCSSGNKGQRIFKDIMVILRQSSTEGRQWNAKSMTPTFSYITSAATTYQFNYDDPWSLRIKYNYVLVKQLRGAGAWVINAAGNGNSTQEVADRQLMWSVIPRVN